MNTADPNPELRDRYTHCLLLHFRGYSLDHALRLLAAIVYLKISGISQTFLLPSDISDELGSQQSRWIEKEGSEEFTGYCNIQCFRSLALQCT